VRRRWESGERCRGVVFFPAFGYSVPPRGKVIGLLLFTGKRSIVCLDLFVHIVTDFRVIFTPLHKVAVPVFLVPLAFAVLALTRPTSNKPSSGFIFLNSTSALHRLSILGFAVDRMLAAVTAI